MFRAWGVVGTPPPPPPFHEPRSEDQAADDASKALEIRPDDAKASPQSEKVIGAGGLGFQGFGGF